AVVALQGPVEVSLRFGRLKRQTASAIVGDYDVTLGKQGLPQEAVQRQELHCLSIPERYKVTNISVNHKQSEGARIIAFGKLARPRRKLVHCCGHGKQSILTRQSRNQNVETGHSLQATLTESVPISGYFTR